jgi:BrnA antitoxin of type II toxin-antitoxin system
MKKKSDTVRYTAKQIKNKIARGEDRTNWAKVNATIGAKLEASIRDDADDVRGEPDWTLSVMGVPAPKDHINIRIDHDVLEWFKKNGRGYQTLMNNVLRAFVQTRRQDESNSR